MSSHARIDLVSLAALCRRLAMATGAGIDLRTIWQREAESGSRSLGKIANQVRDSISRGESVSAAIAATGEYFPPLFRAMVSVGDQTGSLAEVLKRLAEHYEHAVDVRRTFMASLLWPAANLVVAFTVIGVLIWFQGFIAPRGVTHDMLGFGLSGTRGLIIYLVVLAMLGVAVVWLIQFARRNPAWIERWVGLAMRVPVLGRALTTFAVARVAWTLESTLNVAMDVRESLRLALASTGNPDFIRRTDAVVNVVAQGGGIHAALTAAGVFPRHFLDAVFVAEESGQMVECMSRLSRQYEQQSQAATKTLSMVASFVVWALVATLMIVLIFRLYFAVFLKRFDAIKMLK
jgi:type II secretory pathway component PulF